MTPDEARAILNPTPMAVVGELIDHIKTVLDAAFIPGYVVVERIREDRDDLRQIMVTNERSGFGLSIVAGTGVPASEERLYETAELRLKGGEWVVEYDTVRWSGVSAEDIIVRLVDQLTWARP